MLTLCIYNILYGNTNYHMKQSFWPEPPPTPRLPLVHILVHILSFTFICVLNTSDF